MLVSNQRPLRCELSASRSGRAGCEARRPVERASRLGPAGTVAVLRCCTAGRPVHLPAWVRREPRPPRPATGAQAVVSEQVHDQDLPVPQCSLLLLRRPVPAVDRDAVPAPTGQFRPTAADPPPLPPRPCRAVSTCQGQRDSDQVLVVGHSSPGGVLSRITGSSAGQHFDWPRIAGTDLERSVTATLRSRRRRWDSPAVRVSRPDEPPQQWFHGETSTTGQRRDDVWKVTDDQHPIAAR